MNGPGPGAILMSGWNLCRTLMMCGSQSNSKTWGYIQDISECPLGLLFARALYSVYEFITFLTVFDFPLFFLSTQIRIIASFLCFLRFFLRG